jgi:hypothetical protein
VSFEDGRLFIQTLHIDDLIGAECDSASKDERTFRSLSTIILRVAPRPAKNQSHFEGRSTPGLIPNFIKRPPCQRQSLTELR